MLLPTATTPRVGMLYFMPALITVQRFAREDFSSTDPINVWTAIQDAFILMASSISTPTTSAITSSERTVLPAVQRSATPLL